MGNFYIVLIEAYQGRLILNTINTLHEAKVKIKTCDLYSTSLILFDGGKGLFEELSLDLSLAKLKCLLLLLV